MKRLIRLLVFVALGTAVAWWLRERLVPPPQLPEEHPPPFRSAPHAHTPEDPDPVPPDSDDLSIIRGIGPVYRERLADAAVTTFEQLAGADTVTLAEAVDVAAAQVEDWQEQARALV